MQTRQSGKKSILFWVFFLSSIPIAVILISYAAGLRFDTETGTIIENAGISIATTPQNAHVAINGVELEKTTPLVHSLSPGAYTVTITQDHHQMWQKEILVNAGESELFSDVILFGQTTPISTESIPDKQTLVPAEKSLSDVPMRILNGPQIIAVDDTHHRSFLFESFEEKTPLLTINAIVNTAMWNNQDELVYATETELWVWDAVHKNRLIRRQGVKFHDVAWHPKNGYIFYSDLTGLYAIEIDPRDNRQRWKLADVPNADDLILNDVGDTLFYRQGENRYSLQLY